MQNLVVKLSLDNDGFITGIRGSQRAVQSFMNNVQRWNRGMHQSAAATHHWGGAIRDAVVVVGLARHAILNLNAAFTALPGSIIRANADLERMEALMRGLSTSTQGTAAIQAEATESMKKVFSIAKNSPFDINAISDAFVKLQSGGIDPLDGSLQSLVDAVSKFGGTSDVMKRAAIAMQQMAGKGVISMEELRQQLGEAVPTAMQTMARSLGIGVAHLTKVVSTGTLSAKEAMSSMLKLMSLEHAGAAEKMSKTWDGLMNRIKTQLIETAKIIGDTGFYQAMKDTLSEISTAIDTEEFKSAMKEFGRALLAALLIVKQAGAFLYQWGAAITYVIGVLTVGKVVNLTTNKLMHEGSVLTRARTVATNALSAATVAYTNSLNAQNAALAAQRALALSNSMAAHRAGNFAVAAQQLNLANSIGQASRVRAAWVGAGAGVKVAFAGLLSGAKALGGVLLSLAGGWIGVAIISLGTLIYRLWSAKKATEELQKQIKEGDKSFFSYDQLEEMRVAIREFEVLNQRRADAMQLIADAEARIANNPGSVGTESKQIERMRNLLKEIDEERKRLVENWGKDGQGLSVLIDNDAVAKKLSALERDASTSMRDLVNRMRKDTSPMVAQVTEQVSAIFKSRGNENAEAQAEASALYEGLKQTRLKYYDDEIASLEAFQRKHANTTDNDIKLQLAAQQKYLEDLKEMRKAEEESYPKYGKLAMNKNAESDLDKFLKKIEKAKNTLGADVEDHHPLFGAFETLKDEAKLTAVQIDRVLEKLKELDVEYQKNKEKENEETRLSEIKDRLNGMTASIKNTFASDDNPYAKITNDANEYLVKLGQVRAEIEKMNDGKYAAADSAEGKAALATLGEMEKLTRKVSQQAIVTSFTKQARDINTELLPARERLAENHRLEVAQIEEEMAKYKENTELQVAGRELIAAKNAQYARESEKPLQTLARNWGDMTSAMDQAWATTMENFVDTLTDSIMQGKLQLDDFAKSFIAMMIKIQLQKAASMALEGLGFTFANGGVMTSRGSMQLQTYSNGGIANRPQLAVYGEGRQPEAYVPLPDGRTIPVTMKSDNRSSQNGTGVVINVINESGQPISANASEPRFDGKQMIYDIILEGMSRPGNFRDGMRGALRK